MRRSKPEKLKELLSEYIKRRGLNSALENGRIYLVWNKVVGNDLSSLTKHRYFKNGTLYCTIESSAARIYLMQNRELIRNRMNSLLGRECVKAVVIK